MSLLMWGVVYQGYNAVFPSFYPELFQTRVRVTAMAIAQNVGTTITALLPALFAVVAPPGAANIPVDDRRDRARHHGDLGPRRVQRAGDVSACTSTTSATRRGAGAKAEYDRLRDQSLAGGAAIRA